MMTDIVYTVNNVIVIYILILIYIIVFIYSSLIFMFMVDKFSCVKMQLYESACMYEFFHIELKSNKLIFFSFLHAYTVSLFSSNVVYRNFASIAKLNIVHVPN